MPLQVTFIVRNLTPQAMDAIAASDPHEAHATLTNWAFGDLRHCVSVKYGLSDAFGDRVSWNGVVKSGRALAFKIEPRRGYRLITFTEA